MLGGIVPCSITGGTAPAQAQRRRGVAPQSTEPHLFYEGEEGAGGDALRQVGVQVLAQQEHAALRLRHALRRMRGWEQQCRVCGAELATAC